MQATHEQQSAIDMAVRGQNCKVTAYAGAGKTSTLKLIGNTLSHKNGMYLAFNKAIATEAQSKFQSNVKCKTFHSLAYTSVPRWLTQKLSLPRTMRHDLAYKFDLRNYKVPVSKLKQRNEEDTSRLFDANDQANVLLKSIGYFCRSINKEISVTHIQNVMPDWMDPTYAAGLANQLLPKVQDYWKDILDPQGKFKLEHDHYLKYWALKEPVIKSDFILFDEAQDADPIMLDVLSKQRSQVIYVGDKHQQIYGFRGAVNAMQSLDITQTRLSQSFRFGNEIAAIANRILFNVLDETVPLRGFDQINSTVGLINPKTADAYLFRTNAAALNELLNLSVLGRKPKLEADTVTLKIQVEDAKRLKEGFKVGKGSVFEGFNSWPEVQSYVQQLPQSDITPLANLIDKFDVNTLIKALEKSNDSDYDCIISTAHKSKGLEFPTVILGGDFFWNEAPKDDEPIISQDEARLLYVAATRAQNRLDISNLAKLFQSIK